MIFAINIGSMACVNQSRRVPPDKADMGEIISSREIWPSLLDGTCILFINSSSPIFLYIRHLTNLCLSMEEMMYSGWRAHEACHDISRLASDDVYQAGLSLSCFHISLIMLFTFSCQLEALWH